MDSGAREGETTLEEEEEQQQEEERISGDSFLRFFIT
jgi:hypothetical protein